MACATCRAPVLSQTCNASLRSLFWRERTCCRRSTWLTLLAAVFVDSVTDVCTSVDLQYGRDEETDETSYFSTMEHCRVNTAVISALTLTEFALFLRLRRGVAVVSSHDAENAVKPGRAVEAYQKRYTNTDHRKKIEECTCPRRSKYMSPRM